MRLPTLRYLEVVQQKKVGGRHVTNWIFLLYFPVGFWRNMDIPRICMVDYRIYLYCGLLQTFVQGRSSSLKCQNAVVLYVKVILRGSEWQHKTGSISKPSWQSLLL